MCSPSHQQWIEMCHHASDDLFVSGKLLFINELHPKDESRPETSLGVHFTNKTVGFVVI